MAEPRIVCRPIPVEETPGRKAYCQCGWSEKLPYCDGAHARMQTGCRPLIVDVEQPARKWLCQCHASKTLPWCDGTHKQLAPAVSQAPSPQEANSRPPATSAPGTEPPGGSPRMEPPPGGAPSAGDA